MNDDSWNPRNGGFRTPDWVKNAIFYQIFPERFDNGDPENDPPNVKPWGSQPTYTNFMGGDLQGIIDRLDYLRDLGITAIYLNPIFQATSNHKYNTYDYFKIDPHFGTLETFHALLEEAHSRDIRVILDGVFNHCGRGFYAFHDVLENAADSPYLDWFHIDKFPIHAYDETREAHYQSWWNIRSLPKFNTNNPQVRELLLEIARYWMEQGADGWRLDVPNEIADHDFWREFRNVVKSVNPEAYIVGEIWEDATPWLQGDQFDGVMNYLFRDLCVDFFAEDKANALDFAHRVDDLLRRYGPEVTSAQLNLLGSHDTERFLTLAKREPTRAKLATVFQMTYPGVPCIYYGDEVGLLGGKDPDCRRCFPWDEGTWNKSLFESVRNLAALRHKHDALRTGHYRTVIAEAALNVYGFARWNDKEMFLVILNNHKETHTVDIHFHNDLPIPATFEPVLGGQSATPNQRVACAITVKPRSAVILRGDL